LIGKSEGKASPGRPSCRWEDNIRMGVREVGWEVVDWIHLAQDTNNYGLVDMIMNPWVL